MGRVLVVDKPSGMTSHDVVERIRRSSRVRKVGHTGTLDPGATGVLVVLVGKATRLAHFFVDDVKEYRGHMILGVTTDTQDADGKVLETRDPGGVTRSAVERALAGFVGTIKQVPPMVSAIKHEGTPLYVLARKGIVIERQARTINIERLDLLGFEPPAVEFGVVCSSGTYVRTLAADVGEVLGCGAHLGQLNRTRVGPFDIGQALPLGQVERAGRDVESLGVSMLDALPDFPILRIDEDEEETISTGGSVEVDAERLPGPGEGEFVRITSDGVELAAVGRREAGEGNVVVKPVRVFVDAP